MTLTEFLLARIAEEEALASEISHKPAGSFAGGQPKGQPVLAEVIYLTRPADRRRLAACEALRRAIESAWDAHVQIEGEWGSGQSREQMSTRGDNPAVLWDLAFPYIDHPDYLEEWKS